MRHNLRKVLSALLVAVMVLGMTACGGTTFDATAAVKAEMDLLTQKDIDQYVDVMGVSEEEALELYEEIIETMDISAAILQGVEVPEEVEQGYETWFLKLLSMTKYTVNEAVETEDGYTVTVDVEPINAFEGVEAELTAQTTAYTDQVIEDYMNGGEMPSDEEMMAQVYILMLDILNASLENATYGEVVSVDTKIIKNSDGDYEVDDSTFEELGTKLIDVSAMGL